MAAPPAPGVRGRNGEGVGWGAVRDALRRDAEPPVTPEPAAHVRQAWPAMGLRAI